MMPCAETLVVEEVDTLAALERLRPEWSHLCQHDAGATPMQLPEWLIPWWRHVGQGQLCSLAIRAAGHLVGFLPLYIYTDPHSALRQVLPLGVATSDYLDGVFAPGWQLAVANTALSHLAEHRQHWDVIDIPQLRPDSPLLEVSAPDGVSDCIEPSEPCLILALPATVAELHQRLPASLRHNLRYYHRRARQLGSLQMEQATASNIDEFYDALLRLHGARWATQARQGVLADPRVRAWHTEALPALLLRGVLRLYALRLAERIIAAFYGLIDWRTAGKRAYYYLSGFDPLFQQLSPGTLLIACTMERAISEGALFFDFLRGRESYKYHWGATEAILYRRRFRHAFRSSRECHTAFAQHHHGAV